MHISAIVIGLTIVAFGTSMPELMVNIFSAIKGTPDIAIGNIIGSNIANILLVLGIAAIIHPLTIKENTTWKEIPFGLLSVIVLFVLANDVMFGNGPVDILSRGDGIILLAFFIIFLYYTYGLSKIKIEHEKIDTYKWSTSISMIIGGILLLVLGGKLIIDNGVILARMAGLSELFIGLTVTAIGTSLPELATSAIAAYHGHVDIAIGNVVGSNIFNVLWILGITPIISPLIVHTEVNTDMLVAILAALLLFIAMFMNAKHRRHTLQRAHGIVFVLLYIGYITFIAFRG